MKRIQLLIVLILLIFLVYLPLSSQVNSQECEPPDPPPGNDNPDENFSFANSQMAESPSYFDSFPFIGVFMNGYKDSTDSLLTRLKRGCFYVKQEFDPIAILEKVKVLIIPTGGLYGMEKSTHFASILESYVRNGGFLIVFAQQHGYEFSCLPTPDGKPIKAYGWREDMSCQANSVYLSAEHPSVSGLIRTTPSIVVDGYFEQIPENSTVLLRRVKNGYPIAFYYPLGNGYVFVTSMYEDWASANFQSTEEGRCIIRDLISRAKKPSELPTYNFSENPNPTVSLNIEIKNSTE